MTGNVAELTTSERVVRSYFETTSSAEAFTPAIVDHQVAMLGRLLGDWSPVEGEVVVDLGSGMGETCALAVARYRQGNAKEAKALLQQALQLESPAPTRKIIQHHLTDVEAGRPVAVDPTE